MTRVLEVRDLGLVEYEDGVEIQERLVEARHAGQIPDTLVLCEHPHVITKGRGAKAEHILATVGVEVHEAPRGGDVTYHGPGQVIGYPIVDLNPDRRDVRKYVCSIERALVRALARFGIAGECVAPATRGRAVGVFVGRNKIAAIGVRLSRWITSHGFALNVSTDLSKFGLIVPCGLHDFGTTSMAAELGQAPDMAAVRAALVDECAREFVATPVLRGVECETIQVVICAGRRVLLLRRVPDARGFWQTITGRIEPGESPAEAAAREVGEETGIGASLAPLSYVHAFAVDRPGLIRTGREHAFVVRLPTEVPVRLAPLEHDAYEWLDASDAIARVPYKGLKRAIALATLL